MDWIGRGTTDSLACQKDMKMMPDKVTYQENIGFSNAHDHSICILFNESIKPFA